MQMSSAAADRCGFYGARFVPGPTKVPEEQSDALEERDSEAETHYAG